MFDAPNRIDDEATDTFALVVEQRPQGGQNRHPSTTNSFHSGRAAGQRGLVAQRFDDGRTSARCTGELFGELNRFAANGKVVVTEAGEDDVADPILHTRGTRIAK